MVFTLREIIGTRLILLGLKLMPVSRLRLAMALGFVDALQDEIDAEGRRP
ncbi:hypothetical protein [Inquilinus sp. CA228]